MPLSGAPGVPTGCTLASASSSQARRFSDDGDREFDAYLGCWVAVPVVLPVRAAPGPSAMPVGGGSGVNWDVVDRDTGQRLWTIEGLGLEEALSEKRRLCHGVGGKSGWAYLVRQD